MLLAHTKTVPMLNTRSTERAVEPVHPDDCPGCDLATCEAAKRSTAPDETDAAPTKRTSATPRREPADAHKSAGRLTPKDFQLRGRRTKDDPPWKL